jgi:hypothetical protein
MNVFSILLYNAIKTYLREKIQCMKTELTLYTIIQFLFTLFLILKHKCAYKSSIYFIH